MTAGGHRTALRLLLAAIVLSAAAVGAYGLLRATFGTRPVVIAVRWAPAVDATGRAAAERTYGLARGELEDGRTWRYSLLDSSRANIRAMVGDPAVEDTRDIHRTAFRPGLRARREPYNVPRPLYPLALEIVVTSLGLGGLLAALLAAVARIAPAAFSRAVRAAHPARTAAGTWRATAAFIVARWPPASAEAVALFRIAFGVGVLLILVRFPVDPAWAAAPANQVSGAQRLVLDAIVAHPWIATAMRPWLIGWGLLFVAGAFARVSFVMLTAGALAAAALFTTRIESHAVSALLVTLLCLLPSRWSDAWSVDAWRHGRARPAAPWMYGYTCWVPGMVLGVMLAAAGVAKLKESGLAWITNGTVKYHFLSDASQALLDWAPAVGLRPWLAVWLSFAAIAVELAVIVGAVSRRYRWRAAAGGAALLLLVGFALFQGLVWPGWWILLLSFLPWHRLSGTSAAAAADGSETAGRSPVLVAVVLAVVAQQGIATGLSLEWPPVVSAYGMYSTTYDSPAAYEENAAPTYWLLASTGTGVRECRIAQADAALVLQAGTASGRRLPAGQVLRRCFAPELDLLTVAVERRQDQIDWQRWRVVGEARVVLAAGLSPASLQ